MFAIRRKPDSIDVRYVTWGDYQKYWLPDPTRPRGLSLNTPKFSLIKVTLIPKTALTLTKKRG